MTEEWTYTDDEPLTPKEAIDELQAHVERRANIDLQELIAACDKALDWADANARWFDISTAPRDGTKILVTGPDTNGGTYIDVCGWPESWTGRWPVVYMAYAAGDPTHWMPAPPPPSNPPLPAPLERLGEVLRKVKGTT